jgi:aromatic ring-cleaving dioxygenase
VTERFYVCNMGDRFRVWVATFVDGKYQPHSLAIFKEVHHHPEFGQDFSILSLFVE